jgi:hypothetical protein
MERWEKIERWTLVAVSSGIFIVVVRFLVFGHGHPVVLVLVPVGFWALWQAFFEDRLESGVPPSTTERRLAITWLWVRSLTLWAIGVPLSVYSAIAVVGTPNFHSALGPLGGLCIGAFAIWVGAFGAGRAVSTADDLSVHKQRKNRYQWKW